MKKLIKKLIVLTFIVKSSFNYSCHITSNGSMLDKQPIVAHYDNRVEVSYVGSNQVDVYFYRPTLLVAGFNPLKNIFYRYYGPDKMPSFCKLSYFEN